MTRFIETVAVGKTFSTKSGPVEALRGAIAALLRTALGTGQGSEF